MPIASGLHYFAHNETLTSRPPVILIHGAGGSHLTWPAEVRRLPGQRIFALDLPGHGDSSWREDADYSPHTLAPDVATALTTAAVPETQWPGYLAALQGLARTDMIRPRPTEGAAA